MMALDLIKHMARAMPMKGIRQRICWIIYQRLLPFEYIVCCMTINSLELCQNMNILQHNPFYTFFICCICLQFHQSILQPILEAFL